MTVAVTSLLILGRQRTCLPMFEASRYGANAETARPRTYSPGNLMEVCEGDKGRKFGSFAANRLVQRSASTSYCIRGCPNKAPTMPSRCMLAGGSSAPPTDPAPLQVRPRQIDSPLHVQRQVLARRFDSQTSGPFRQKQKVFPQFLEDKQHIGTVESVLKGFIGPGKSVSISVKASPSG